MQFSAELRFPKGAPGVIINGDIGLGFSADGIIYFGCDKRIHIERKNIKARLYKPQPAKKGILTLFISMGHIIFVGNESPLVIERVNFRFSEPIIKIRHSKPISVKHAGLDHPQLRQRLTSDLASNH